MSGVILVMSARVARVQSVPSVAKWQGTHAGSRPGLGEKGDRLFCCRPTTFILLAAIVFCSYNKIAFTLYDMKFDVIAS